MSIPNNLETIKQRIRSAEQQHGRTLGSVQLLAVSKYHPVTALEQAFNAGQSVFGENYVQEMADKTTQLQASMPDKQPEWHFIGPLQSNKTRQIAGIAHWVHSVDRLKVARRLSDQKPEAAPALNICLQVNVSGEDSKSGVTPTELPALAEQVAELSGIRLRGLMAIPAPETNVERQRAVFAHVREMQEDLISRGFALDTLSMGMTGDMEAAIAEGATIVRIGTAIFGAREY